MERRGELNAWVLEEKGVYGTAARRHCVQSLPRATLRMFRERGEETSSEKHLALALSAT